MQFRAIRSLDQIAGRLLLGFLPPLCRLLTGLLPPRCGTEPRQISFLKLHGGGSILIAFPSLLGLRQLYPQAVFTLVCTAETKAYAELTGCFDRLLLIDTDNIVRLFVSSFMALLRSLRSSVFIDLEPHSFMAAVFTCLSLSTRRLGFVKSNEYYRAKAYTDALYFNPQAPIFAFYDQLAGLLGAIPVSINACRTRLAAALDQSSAVAMPLALSVMNGEEIIYLAPFCSEFAPERMMPDEQWPQLLANRHGERHLTVLIGGGASDRAAGERLIQVFKTVLPQVQCVNLCGQRSLPQTLGDIGAVDEFWGIDSGPLHIARLLGKPCFSFWGPTNPAHRLRAFPGLPESAAYINLACSPCIDSVERSPCAGNNQCMRHFLNPLAATPPILIHSRANAHA